MELDGMFYKINNNTKAPQLLLFSLGMCMVVYAICVLVHVSSSYQIGIHTILTPEILAKPTNVKPEDDATTPDGIDHARVVQIGDRKIHTWKDVLEAPGELHTRIESRR